uniref:ABC transporter ATP-binding protein n=1 Tax=Acetatifactor sp. TaxID=1872090 RepID=UPI00405710E1
MKTDIKQKVQKERPKYSFWKNSAYMIQLAWRVCKSVLVLCVITALLAVATNLAELFITPIILKKIESAVPLPELLTTIIDFAMILLILNALTSYVSHNTIFGRVEVRLDLLRQATYKVATTSFPNTEDTLLLKKQDKAAMALSGNQQATEAIWDTLTKLLQYIISFIIYLIFMTHMNPLLIAVILITTIAGYFINKYIYEWGYRHRDEESELSKKMNYISEATEKNDLGKDIRIFGMKGWLQDIYDSTHRLYRAFIARRERTYLFANITDIIMTLLRNGVAYFYLIHLILEEGLSASVFLLYFTAVGNFTSQVTGIFSLLSTMHQQSLDISALREYLEMPEPFKFEAGKPLPVDANASYEFQLKNVSFRYPEADTNILHQINLTIHPGENLAIVGLNGAGKTTLIKLLCGFYDPTEGEVLLNGVNIREYNRRDYYRLFSAVFQNFSLLEATIAENVTQSATDKDAEKLNDCIEKAGLSDTVNNLPNQLQTHIGDYVFEDSVELSGGQTQRLMLARALYKNAPIIVLDEPTAALDPIAENDIYLKYNEMTAGKTSVFISHRLASTRFCDRILFLSDGSIAEEGTHESLMTLGGQYAELFRVQSKYYQEGGADHAE